MEGEGGREAEGVQEGGHYLGVVFEGDEHFAFLLLGGGGGGGGGGGVCHGCGVGWVGWKEMGV